MSDPIENFELILKKHRENRTLKLYDDIKQQIKHTVKPQDVISTVSLQLKAIQSADSVKIGKGLQKELNKYNNSTFLSVNNLPVYQEVPKAAEKSIKFDTQCVTDTELIGLIEDAEILDHQGITQEFENTFKPSCSNTDKTVTLTGNNDTKSQLTEEIVNKNSLKQQNIVNKSESVHNIGNTGNITDKKPEQDDFDIHSENLFEESCLANTTTAEENEKTDNSTKDSINTDHNPLEGNSNELDILEVKTQETNQYKNSIPVKDIVEDECSPILNQNYLETTKPVLDSPDDTIYSQILPCKTYKPPKYSANKTQYAPKTSISTKQIEKWTQESIHSQNKSKNCQEHKENTVIEPPLSPIFSNIQVKRRKTKSPSPLIFNLDTFEQFETMAIPIMEANDLKTAKMVINSQILNRELCINFNNDSNDIHILSNKNDTKIPIPEKDNSDNVNSVVNNDTSTDIEFIKATSEILSKAIKDTGQDGKNNESQVLKDEILFSSDEESDNAHRNYQDLPFTCALETSFYNQSDVLDKTMYVGFQTASNRSIQVCKESFTKAVSLLDDVNDNDGPSITELVKNCDSSLKTIQNMDISSNVHTNTEEEIHFDENDDIFDLNIQTKSVSKEECSPEQNNHQTELVDCFKKPEEPKKSIINEGFKTASNKNIQISKKSLARCKKVFQDIDLSDDFDNKTEDFKNTKQFVGFKTASDKNINLSDKDLAKCKQVFQDIDLNEKFDEEVVSSNHTNNNEKPNNIGEVNNLIDDTQMNIDDALVQELDNIEMSLQKETLKDNILAPLVIPHSTSNIQESSSEKGFVGFKTANNRNIKISEKALANVQNIFKDIDSIDLDMVKNNEPSKDYKNEKILNKSITKSELDFEKDDELNMNNVIDAAKIKSAPENFPGFKTASRRKIIISEEALKRTRNIFKDLDQDDLTMTTKNKKDYPDFDNNCETELVNVIKENPKEIDIVKFPVFQTASNKHINISKEALKKTKNMFNNIDTQAFPSKQYDDKNETPNTKNISKDVYPIANAKTAPENDLKESEKNLKANVEMAHDLPKDKEFVGFQTANNKKVKISEEALAKTKDIFKDIDTSNFKTPNKDPIFTRDVADKVLQNEMAFIGFQTANNQSIPISKTALAKTKDLFKDIDSPNCPFDKDIDRNSENNVEKAVFHGFQTGSNKRVNVSEDALAKTKNIFKDVDINSDNVFEKPCHGFQTASNKRVTVSKDALAKTKNIFKDIDMTLEKDIETSVCHGFQTASNKQVNISEDALAKTKNIFKDIEDNIDINTNIELLTLHGFQTASSKPVNISEEALAKTKNIFKDIDINTDCNTLEQELSDNTHDNNLENIVKDNLISGTLRNIKGVDTHIDKNKLITNHISKANDRETNNTSKNNTQRVKRPFSEIDDSISITNTNKKVKKQVSDKETLNNMIDTQVLNNFNESLHTEDFCNTPEKDKRSGSPILSCPRAKKRKKFEIPYSQNKPIPVTNITIEATKINNSKIIFDPSYKQNKKYTLKDLAIMTRDVNSTTDPYYLLKFSFNNLDKFEFIGERNNLTTGKMTVDNLKEIFLSSVNKKLVPNGWIDNHIRLILWKLISYEVKFKSTIVCDARNVIEQLKYRYDVELYDAKRSALRKIMEKDDVPSKTLVLCVAGIYVDDISVTSLTNLTDKTELLLTDGWYAIKCCIDKMLRKYIYEDRIRVGSKIVTTGAELLYCDQGVSPWEDTSAIRLKIFGNSTRRARWDARLGYHGNAAILCRLSAISLLGGKVSKCRVYVTRVYPTLYVHKFEDGSSVTRSERLEHLYQAKMETERQTIMEKIYEEVEKEFADQESQDSEEFSGSDKRSCLDSGSQIAKMMRRSKDPGVLKEQLTSSQQLLLEQHTSKRRERLLEDIQNRIKQKLDKCGVLSGARNVVTLLKIRVADVVDSGHGVEVVKGMMSIWKPTDAVLEIIKEGAWIDVMNVIPTAMRYSEIQLSAGRQTVFSTSKYKESDKIKSYTTLLKRKCFTIKELAQNPQMTSDYNEIDTVGLVFLIDPSIREFDLSKQQFQNIYLTDADKNMICINFWGGLKKFGFENILDTGQIIFCGNLQKRLGNTRKNIPQYRVTEFSYFTKSPKNDNSRVVLEELNGKFTSLDRRKFIEDCVVLKNNYSVFKHNTENISPYRSNISDCNVSKNKMFIDSPLNPKKVDDNFNLTGLDFESSFQQMDPQMSEEMLQRKKKVNEKIAKLKRYGEPPPLSPIYILNKSKNAANSYKSPLLNNSKSEGSSNISDSSINVASPKNTPQKCGITASSRSPVLNRTFVKSVNPVKINFDVKDNNDSNIDYFAEEFDGSPPLSLD